MGVKYLQLKMGRERSVVNRHPWIFSGGVQSINAREGDIVAVMDSKKKVLGYGFYSSKSQISCRMFHWGSQEQDFESVAYWKGKMENALRLRKNILPPDTDSFRLLHAEGDFMPGFIADVYGNVCVVQILAEAVERRKEVFVQALKELGYNSLYKRSSLSSGSHEDTEQASEWISGEAAPSLIIKENGLRFKVDIVGGQKTGFFLDQRDNRNLVRQLAGGRKVLNAFSYTGGFSVYAAAGGAEEVHSLDISADAVKMAAENMQLGFPQVKHQAIAEDCFEYLRKMPDNFYDLIILDPPAFAKSKAAVDRAARGYKDINLKAFQKVKEEGIVFTFSCSHHVSSDLFRKIVFSAAADAGRNVRILYQLHQPPDHPVNIYHPEGEYLKGLVLQVS